MDFSKNDQCFELYISLEKYILNGIQKKEPNLLTNLERSISINMGDHITRSFRNNNNYKILCKYMEFVKEYKVTSHILICFLEAILLNKLEYADLLLNYIDFKNRFHPSIESKYISNLHVDAIDYLHDLIIKKGMNISLMFVQIMIRHSIYEDKFDIFCYILKLFPDEALKVGDGYYFNLKNFRYLVRLHELEQEKKLIGKSLN